MSAASSWFFKSDLPLFKKDLYTWFQQTDMPFSIKIFHITVNTIVISCLKWCLFKKWYVWKQIWSPTWLRMKSCLNILVYLLVADLMALQCPVPSWVWPSPKLGSLWSSFDQISTLLVPSIKGGLGLANFSEYVFLSLFQPIAIPLLSYGRSRWSKCFSFFRGSLFWMFTSLWCLPREQNLANKKSSELLCG